MRSAAGVSCGGAAPMELEKFTPQSADQQCLLLAA
jgi:hypothetical protein